MPRNPDLVRNRSADIWQSLDQIACLPREVLLADQDTFDIASYRLLVAIEAANVPTLRLCNVFLLLRRSSP